MGECAQAAGTMVLWARSGRGGCPVVIACEGAFAERRIRHHDAQNVCAYSLELSPGLPRKVGKALVGGAGRWRDVIAVAHVQIGVRIGDADQAVKCIVVIGGGDATRIGGRLAVAGGVHGW